MAIPDDALGIDVDFPSLEVTNGLRFAMQLGRNANASKAIHFMARGSGSRTYWKNDVQLGSTPRLDSDGNPLDPDVEVRPPEDTEILDGDKPVDCAVEVEPRDALETPVGNFRPTKVIVTALGPQYQLIKDCRKILYNGDEYMLGYEPESVGLFDLEAYTLIFYAKDES